jgi:hypothetical protein
VGATSLYLYPTKVFIDGRATCTAKFCLNYIDVVSVKYDWSTRWRAMEWTPYCFDDDAVSRRLKESPGWRVVYDDHLAIVFRPALSAAGPVKKFRCRADRNGP